MALVTIGYEAYGLPAFIDRLTGEGVTTLIDIRQLANSRRAGFSKTLLRASLAEAGIGYRHHVALGTPKAGREAAKRGDMASLRAIYAEVLEHPQAGLDLAAIASEAQSGPQSGPQSGTICLMCLEEDWTKCHRALVCERLEADFGVTATHLHRPS